MLGAPYMTAPYSEHVHIMLFAELPVTKKTVLIPHKCSQIKSLAGCFVCWSSPLVLVLTNSIIIYNSLHIDCGSYYQIVGSF